MKKLSLTALIWFLTANLCCVCAGEYSFSGHGTKWFGSDDKSRMCTVSFSADESSPSGEVRAAFRFINTGNVPLKGDPFFSQKAEVVSKDGKTYEMSWYSGKVELKDGRIFEIPGKVTPEKVADTVAHHPELQKTSSFEKLSLPLTQELEEASKQKSIQLINPGGAVEKVFYNKDPLIRSLILSQNVDSVVFYSGMGKFVLRQRQ